MIELFTIDEAIEVMDTMIIPLQHKLSDKDRFFITDIRQRCQYLEGSLSIRQSKWLEDILRKLTCK